MKKHYCECGWNSYFPAYYKVKKGHSIKIINICPECGNEKLSYGKH